MFKKLKDKIAEEVKSSPQRIQQFAQAAQAAVTSASSSVSDITSNDLFSIGGDDTPQNSPAKTSDSNLHVNSFQDVSLSQTPSPGVNLFQDHSDAVHNDGKLPGRRLSNSSIASDVSFRLPSYESPATMYHLQSDMDVSASETEDVRFTPGALDHVSKEQIFAAYKRSQERYNKYRGRYADLARHYRNLERENAKARAVLVETQDKALRRISELREQCALEQSAKAHLENALRMDLDEKNIKIESLTTKIRLLQSYSSETDIVEKAQNLPQKEENNESESKQTMESPAGDNLIDLSGSKSDSENTSQSTLSEISVLEKKVTKYEKLASKYMEALRNLKEKNTQLTTEIQIISDQLQKKINDNEQLEIGMKQLTELRQQLVESNDDKKNLQFKLNEFENKKSEDIARVENDLESARIKIKKLHEEITILNRREEENAISLAENKLSVHKELEDKEKEIKHLKDNLETIEVNSLETQKQITDLKDENTTLNSNLAEFNKNVESITTLENTVQDLNDNCRTLENKNLKMVEDLKRMEMQLKQEVAEKLAMTDRNNYLESRNKQLSDENIKKSKHASDLEKEILNISKNKNTTDTLNENYNSIVAERNELQAKYENLESNLKSAIENYALLESKLIDFSSANDKLQTNLNEKLEELHKSNAEKEDFEKKLEKISEDLKSKLTEADEKLLKVESDVKNSLANDMKNKIIELETKMRNSYEAKLAKVNKKEDHNLQHKINEMTTVIDVHLEDLRKSKIEHQSLIAENKFLQEKIEQYQNELASAEKQVQSYATLVSQNETLDEKLAEYATQIDSFHKLKLEHEQIIEEKQNFEELVKSLEKEKTEIKNKADVIIKEVEELQTELTSIKKSHDEIVLEKNELESRITSMENSETISKTALIEKEDQLKSLLSDSESAKLQIESLCKENKLLEEKLKENNAILKEKEQRLIEFSGNNETWQEKLSTILEDNNRLQEKCGRLKQDKDTLIEKSQITEQKLTDFVNITRLYEESKLEKEFLNMRISQLESDLNQSNKAKHDAVSEKDLIQKEIATITTEKKNRILTLNENINRLKAEVQTLSEERNKFENDLTKEVQEKQKAIEELKSVQLQIENSSLETSEKNSLEIVVADLKNKLEAVETENVDLRTQVKHLEQKCLEVEQNCKSLEDINAELKTEKDLINAKLVDLERLELENKADIEELRKIKEERNRFSSDIEGLRAHLTKVSKDNSQLNDKIRELIANDTSDVGNGLSDSHQALKNDEIDTLKEENIKLTERLQASVELQKKLEDLQKKHENVSKEKQDLEKQLDMPLSRSSAVSSYGSVEKEQEIKQLTGKNKQLLQDKLQLESRMAEMELMSRSGDSNMRQIEQKNEKLRLMNEKLERRLDEALVSLRHFRSLEESTELEYLRNILYEYLTGPSTHSVTLAKVLSAVVKFDDRQTDLVLQREKERQGLLGQLGLL